MNEMIAERIPRSSPAMSLFPRMVQYQRISNPKLREGETLYPIVLFLKHGQEPSYRHLGDQMQKAKPLRQREIAGPPLTRIDEPHLRMPD
jgi:hypothetical protein